LRTHIEFQSESFPAYPDEAAETNPGIFGRRLGEFLAKTLPEHGVATGDLIGESWGWCLTLPNADFSMWMGCGNQYESDNRFLCFIEPSKPYVRRWFRKIDTRADVDRVATALEAALRSAEVRDLRWWAEDEV
jgi:hypothetical protein